jgi:Na+-driven multidrug efflux pump
MAFSTDTEVVTTGIEFLRRLMPPYFLLSIIFIINAALRGAGQSMLPLIFTMTALLGVRVPSAYLYNYLFGKYAIFWCFGTGWAVGIMLCVPYYLSGHWKKSAFRYLEKN